MLNLNDYGGCTNIHKEIGSYFTIMSTWCCSDGVTRSGLFCAALTVMDKIDQSREVEIFEIVNEMRRNRHQLIIDKVWYI